MKFLLANLIFTACLILLVSSNAYGQGTSQVKFSTEKEIADDISVVPCRNKERLEGVKKLFLSKGASATDIKIEDFKYVKNLVVKKSGKKAKETVVIGAHYDELGGGCGAIDNWTGIVIIANLFRTIKDLQTEKNYIFVAFGKEEQGLLGSKAMASAIPKEERINYCAMVNLDSFGMAYPQVMRNISDKRLIDLAKKTAKALEMPTGTAAIQNASSDSYSFLSNKIPAISIHGLGNRWKDYLHSSRDKVKNVKPTSVYFGYRFALSFLAAIEASRCDAFRKKKKVKK